MRLLPALLIPVLAAFTPIQAHARTARTGDNAEIAALFKSDQSARENIRPEQFRDREFVARMIEGDRARRERARVLLREGGLRTGGDFYHAAFIFQHGSLPEDYLLAHTLAVASAARGNRDAAWIAAATLDRYLQKIGQKQIYGTQYLSGRETGATMEPYDRNLVPDTLREALGVPSQAKQEERLAGMKSGGPLGK